MSNGQMELAVWLGIPAVFVVVLFLGFGQMSGQKRTAADLPRCDVAVSVDPCITATGAVKYRTSTELLTFASFDEWVGWLDDAAAGGEHGMNPTDFR